MALYALQTGILFWHAELYKIRIFELAMRRNEDTEGSFTLR